MDAVCNAEGLRPLNGYVLITTLVILQCNFTAPNDSTHDQAGGVALRLVRKAKQVKGTGLYNTI